MLELQDGGRIRDASGNYGIVIKYPNGKSIRVIVPDLELEKYKDLHYGYFAIDFSKTYDSKVYDQELVVGPLSD
jgi:hypothetical protein